MRGHKAAKAIMRIFRQKFLHVSLQKQSINTYAGFA